MIALWGRASAYNVQKVLWLLDELQIDFQHHEVGSGEKDLQSESFLALNPHARIPVLEDDGLVIWESNTILRYLAAQYAGADFYPIDPVQRSQQERWMDWELATLQVDFLALFWGYYRTPEALRDSVAIEASALRCAERLTLLDQQLSQQPYVAGEAFSLADICCGSFLYRYLNMGLEAIIQPTHLMDWYQRLTQRPAYQHRIMQPFSSLFARQTF